MPTLQEPTTSRTSTTPSVTTIRAKKAGKWMRKSSGIVSMILIILFIIYKNHQEHGEININKLTDQVIRSVVRQLDIVPISGEFGRLISSTTKPIEHGDGRPPSERRKAPSKEHLL